MIYRLALSGLINSGKDFVAEKCGYKRQSFAKPLYALAKWFFGTDEYKTNSDLRIFLQKVGQWGWGYHDPEKSPYTTERAVFCALMRDQGAYFTQMTEYSWKSFGLRKTFWVDGLLQNIAYNCQPKELIAITNVRYSHEINPLKNYDYSHYLVCCSEETRMQRCGGNLPHEVDYDISEAFARYLVTEIEPSHIIWNDSAPKPISTYLSLEEFQKLALATE